jgi:hypothetical protein
MGSGSAGEEDVRHAGREHRPEEQVRDGGVGEVEVEGLVGCGGGAAAGEEDVGLEEAVGEGGGEESGVVRLDRLVTEVEVRGPETWYEGVVLGALEEGADTVYCVEVFGVAGELGEAGELKRE